MLFKEKSINYKAKVGVNGTPFTNHELIYLQLDPQELAMPMKGIPTVHRRGFFAQVLGSILETIARVI